VSTTQQRLDERYGRTPRAERRARVVMIGGGIGVVGVLAAWVIWGGLSGTNAQLETRELGYRDVTATSITVRWEVSVDPGSEVTCAVQALNESFGIVGWKVVDIPASTERTRAFEETLRTAEQAVTGLPYRCWLP